MTQTLVAVFENPADAMQARSELLQSGFNNEDVSVQDGDAASNATTTEGARAMRQHEGGISGFLRSLFGFDDGDAPIYEEAVRRGASVLTINVTSDDEASAAEACLRKYPLVDLEERASSWRQEGWNSAGETSGQMENTSNAGRQIEGRERIPVVEEELQIGKRAVARGGLRVYTRVIETPVEETVQLREERAEIERRPVDRAATEEDFQAMREGTIEVRETGEEAVVAKRARVVEEVDVGKRTEQREQTVRDSVRKTDVQVEKLDAESREHSVAADASGTPGTRSKSSDASSSAARAVDRGENAVERAVDKVTGRNKSRG